MPWRICCSRMRPTRAPWPSSLLPSTCTLPPCSRDLSHPDRNHDQRELLLKLRTSIQLADFVELCSECAGPQSMWNFMLFFPGNSGADRPVLFEAIAQLYFSHAIVSQEIASMHEEHE